MPGDVDIALKTWLEKAKEFVRVQRKFDLCAWQMVSCRQSANSTLPTWGVTSNRPSAAR